MITTDLQLDGQSGTIATSRQAASYSQVPLRLGNVSDASAIVMVSDTLHRTYTAPCLNSTS